MTINISVKTEVEDVGNVVINVGGMLGNLFMLHDSNAGRKALHSERCFGDFWRFAQEFCSHYFS